MRNTIVLMALAAASASAGAQIRITEWMYNGGTEFIELTNVGGTAIDMTGWSYADSARTPGLVDLSSFGIVDSGESVIITEVTVADFEFAWSLPAGSVKIFGENSVNLGRSDEVNIYRANDVLVDRLTYGDQVFVGSIRTNAISGVPQGPAALGANDVFQWKLSTVGDENNSYASVLADIGNPGFYIPTPGALALLAGAGLMASRRRR